ncbi:outer membrane protein assembly factor BamB [Noviherbaspirillum denitrificans]|uniref:Outer membrane protein assembly factor BamB n=1 Tax=Noviherbaspirillum denitrificans TaxID=1968433 RepID=A0A254TFD7_9BURK|nr:outer membrane protein assembly factor BamB [Noviherbaspirillum denitrificans]OWW20877.1 outer membrane protein assembly factor BamB [Noviherbaspirillum denitrificans]
MRIAVKLTCVGMVALVAGCSSLNPFASKPAPRNPPAALEDFKQTLGVRTAWSTSIGNAGEFVFSPAVSGDSVFAAAADGTIVRIEGASGRTVWRINADARLTAGVGSDGRTVAVAAEKGVLLAYDADGKLRWKVQASSEILSTPAVGQGVVVVRSVDNRVAAYDAETGSRRWVVQRTSPPLTLRSAPGIAISGTSAFVALPGGRLLALALSNGGARWEVAVGDPRGTTELERIADLSGTPFVAGRDVCAVAYQGRVACFDSSNGTARWAKDLSSEVGLAVDERNVYAADEQGAVTAFARDTGSGAWRNNKLANRRLSAPVVMSRALAVGDAQGYIHFLSREDGAFLARVPTDGSRVVAVTPLSANSGIFQTQAGTIVALATE